MSKSNHTIRTTHIGSLPRPPRLRELLADEARDEGDEEFETVVADAIRDVVRRQAEVGLDVGNDGEQARRTFHAHVTRRLRGYSGRAPEYRWSDLEEFPEYAERAFGGADDATRPIATEPIAYVGEDHLRQELSRFESALAAEDVAFDERFLTAPSPGIVATGTENEYYEDDETYLFELADALRTEYELIVDSGATLQVDAPDLLADYHRAHKGATVEAFRDRVRTGVRALNEALANVPAEQVRLHACWGNYPGPHHHDVELDAVVDEIYEADVGGLVVEAANPRHAHEHRTFAEHPLPDGWTLYPGVIDVKTNIVEHPETVAERIERFVDIVGDPERVVATADCGFATLAGLHTVDPEIAWTKLETLVRGAEVASSRLR